MHAVDGLALRGRVGVGLRTTRMQVPVLPGVPPHLEFTLLPARLLRPGCMDPRGLLGRFFDRRAGEAPIDVLIVVGDQDTYRVDGEAVGAPVWVAELIEQEGIR